MLTLETTCKVLPVVVAIEVAEAVDALEAVAVVQGEGIVEASLAGWT